MYVYCLCFREIDGVVYVYCLCFREIDGVVYVFCLCFREIDGVVYPGDVKEKEQARQQYERAKQRGQSAGHVAAS